MANCIQTELSKPFQCIIDIVGRHYDQEKQDIDDVKEEVNRFLRRLRIALTQLVPSRPFVGDVYFTRDLIDMSGTDLVHMFNATPDMLDVCLHREQHDYNEPLTDQHQVLADGSTVFESSASNNTTSLLFGHTAANSDDLVASPAPNHIVSRAFANETFAPIPPSPRSFPSTTVYRTTTPTDEQSKKRSRQRLQTSIRSKQPKFRTTPQKSSLGSVLYPIDKSLPGVQELFNLLTPRHGADTTVLVYIYAETVTLSGFPQFENALQFFCSNKKIRLPHQSQGLLPLMDVLERIEGGQSFLCLCRSVGLLRVRSHYARVERELATDVPDADSEGQGVGVRRTLPSRTYDLLVREARTSVALGETEDQTRKKIRNHVAAGRIWSILCNTMGSGFLALIYRVAPSILERVSSSAINILVQFLQKHAPSEVLSLASILSYHLPAILEGYDCNFATAIIGGTVRDWHSVLAIANELSPCLHSTSQQ